MSDHALFIGWGSARTGREAAAGKLFQDAVAYWQGLKASGEIEDVELVLLTLHGGDLRGFALLRGEAAKLAALAGTPEYERFLFQAGALLDGVGVVNALVDDGVLSSMQRWGEAMADLG